MLMDLKMFDILRTKEWYCEVSGGAENLIQTKLVKSKYCEIFPKIWRWGGIGKPVFCRSSYSLRYMEQTQEGSQELKKKGFPLKREIDDWETGDWQRRYFPATSFPNFSEVWTILTRTRTSSRQSGSFRSAANHILATRSWHPWVSLLTRLDVQEQLLHNKPMCGCVTNLKQYSLS